MLTTSSQTFTYQVTASATVSDAQLQFQVGGGTSDVYIDDVSITTSQGGEVELHPAIAGLSSQLSSYIGGAYDVNAGGATPFASFLSSAGLTGANASILKSHTPYCHANFQNRFNTHTATLSSYQ